MPRINTSSRGRTVDVVLTVNRHGEKLIFGIDYYNPEGRRWDVDETPEIDRVFRYTDDEVSNIRAEKLPYVRNWQAEDVDASYIIYGDYRWEEVPPNSQYFDRKITLFDDFVFNQLLDISSEEEWNKKTS